MKKNVTLYISKVSNCYMYGISIQGYTKKEMSYKSKHKQVEIALNSSLPENYYSLDFDDEELCKEDYIECFIQDYCEQNNIDIDSVRLAN